MDTTTVLDLPTGFTAAPRPIRFHERWLARLRSDSLDTELADGYPPATRRLRAVRAHQLFAERGTVARAWAEVLDDATSGAVHCNRMPVNRRAVVDADELIRAVVAALAAPSVPVRAVAMARLLLTDGTGPLYRRGRLDAALLEVLYACPADGGR